MTPRASTRRRVWCEAGDLLAVARPAVLAPLASRSVELIAAVFPATLGQIPALLDACARSRVRVSLWPMLDDDDGRWANTSTLPAYARLARAALHAADFRPLCSVFVDLEPPISRVKAALRSPRAARHLLTSAHDAGATALLVELADEAAARGATLSAAALPLMALEPASSAGWSRALGVPLAGVPWDAVHLMTYSSLLVGYSGGALGPRVARDLVGLTAQAARGTFGERAALSLGVVGAGALGDERPFDSLRALRHDVAAARSAGVEDLALFDLLGALRRPPVEAWLDALHEPPTAAPPRSWRARAIGGACWGAGMLLNRVAGV